MIVLQTLAGFICFLLICGVLQGVGFAVRRFYEKERIVKWSDAINLLAGITIVPIIVMIIVISYSIGSVILH